MLKDRAVQIRFIREPALPRTTASAQREPEAVWTPEVVSAMIQDQIQSIMFTAGMLYAGKVLVDTLSQVILKKTRTKDKTR